MREFNMYIKYYRCLGEGSFLCIVRAHAHAHNRMIQHTWELEVKGRIILCVNGALLLNSLVPSRFYHACR